MNNPLLKHILHCLPVVVKATLLVILNPSRHTNDAQSPSRASTPRPRINLLTKMRWVHTVALVNAPKTRPLSFQLVGLALVIALSIGSWSCAPPSEPKRMATIYYYVNASGDLRYVNNPGGTPVRQ